MSVISRTLPSTLETDQTARTTRPAHTHRSPVAPSLRPSPLRTALRLAADPSRWRPHVDFDPERRYHRRLLADEHHEAWLLTWLPGQGTLWHDHGGSGGAFVVLRGPSSRAPRCTASSAPHGTSTGAGSPTGSAPTTCTASQRGARPGGLPPRLRARLEVQHDYVSEDGILRRIATRREGDDW